MQNNDRAEFLCPYHREKLSCVKISELGNKMECHKCIINQQICYNQKSDVLNQLRLKKIKMLNDQQNQSEKRLSQLKKMFVRIKETLNDQMSTIIQNIEDGNNQILAEIKNDVGQITKTTLQIPVEQVEQEIAAFMKESSSYDQHYFQRNQKIRVSAIEQYLLLIKKINKQVQLESVWDQNEKKVEINERVQQATLKDELKQYERVFKQRGVFSCCTMAMDKDENIVVNDESELIKVWKFTEGGQLILSQTLEGHSSNIRCLRFSKISYWFISGSEDNTLIIWKEHNCSWIQFQLLEGHTHSVLDVIINNDEDQLISCSVDRTIRIWMIEIKSNLWRCKQILTEHINTIRFLSFNKDCNGFTSCGDDRLRIWEKSKGQYWRQIQVVDHLQDDKYLRICFLGQNELLATNQKQGRLSRLEKNTQGTFILKSQLILNENQDNETQVFPLVYNEVLSIGICRHNNDYTYIFTRQLDKEFTIHQVLQGNYHSGQVLHNGKYLILGEQNNSIIEVWKLK